MEIHQAQRTQWGTHSDPVQKLPQNSREQSFSSLLATSKPSRQEGLSQGVSAKPFDESGIFGSKGSNSSNTGTPNDAKVKSGSAQTVSNTKAVASSTGTPYETSKKLAKPKIYSGDNASRFVQPKTSNSIGPSKQTQDAQTVLARVVNTKPMQQVQNHSGKNIAPLNTSKNANVIRNFAATETTFMNIAIASTLHGLDVKIRAKHMAAKEKEIIEEKVIEFLNAQPYSLVNLKVETV